MDKQPLLPDSNIPRVVIIGAGFGGLELIKELRHSEIEIVVFDKHNYHTFQPLLYQVATGGLEPASIAFPYRKHFKKFRNLIFRMAEVTRVDPSASVIYTNLGHLSFDYLVIASGSKTNFFGLDDVRANGFGMKEIPESLNLRSLILQNFEKALIVTDPEHKDFLMHFVVVGGGPTGVEMCGALSELKRFVLPNDYPELDIRRMEIHLVEAGPELLGGMSKGSSQKAFDFLKKMGVRVWLNSQVTGYDGSVVTLKSGKRIKSRTVLWAAGVEGNLPEGFEGNTGRGKRIITDDLNKVGPYNNIFAIGDVALIQSETAPKGHPMVAQVAIQQGRRLGKNIRRILKGKEPVPFRYKDKGSMATVGRNKAVVDLPYFHTQGSFAWFIWMFIHLLSLVGIRNKLVVLIDWFWNYISYDRALRLIIRPFKPENNSTVGK